MNMRMNECGQTSFEILSKKDLKGIKLAFQDWTSVKSLTVMTYNKHMSFSFLLCLMDRGVKMFVLPGEKMTP